MIIKVRLFATLRNGRGKEIMFDLGEGGTVRHIVTSLEIPESEVAILLINGRDGTLDKPLVPSDIVSIFPPVGGG